MTSEYEIPKSVIDLTESDRLLWDNDSQGCYTTIYEGTAFRLGCTANASAFFVDGVLCQIGRKGVMTLCHAIAIQSIRRRKNMERLDIINERLKRHVSGLPTKRAQ